MKFSIITVVYNNVDFVGNCIESVLSQSYKDIEYIVIDGGSTDGTLDVAARYRSRISKMLSERDSGYVYAVNKGLKLATGDVVGLLHSDDFYAHNRVIEDVAAVFKERSPDTLYGDLVYVKKDNTKKVVRYWKGGTYSIEKLKRGWMPPHPTFFVKRAIYERYGYFNTDFKIAADYEIMLRFLYKHSISTYYVPNVLVKMRIGGVSNRSFRNILMKSREDYKACKLNNMERQVSTIMLKNIAKIPQFFVKERRSKI